jgi:hypothetical protein
MLIWKWSLVQTILDGYSFKQLFISYNERHILIVDEAGEIGVRKKQYTFQKRKRNVGHSKRLVLEIEKSYPNSLFEM